MQSRRLLIVHIYVDTSINKVIPANCLLWINLLSLTLSIEANILAS